MSYIPTFFFSHRLSFLWSSPRMHERMFCAKGSLDYHRKLKHSEGVEIKCERCPEVFMDFKLYTLHKANVHTKASIVQCRECYVDIKGKGNLTRHMTEVHNVESRFDIGQVECPVYPYKCDEAECYSAFKRKSDLDRHQNAKHVKNRCYAVWKSIHICYKSKKVQ